MIGDKQHRPIRRNALDVKTFNAAKIKPERQPDDPAHDAIQCIMGVRVQAWPFGFKNADPSPCLADGDRARHSVRALTFMQKVSLHSIASLLPGKHLLPPAAAPGLLPPRPFAPASLSRAIARCDTANPPRDSPSPPRRVPIENRCSP